MERNPAALAWGANCGQRSAAPHRSVLITGSRWWNASTHGPLVTGADTAAYPPSG
ncbi:hypothetical protein [Actinoplanes sp. DH11]|uniref:hypothetical protein n=1 Tax=Actinoplanes sp. DH11 TaxID=2857011 RepID=UPI001E3640C6|nr:hypothetical protein [Actinoplanes sp. DH11]